MRRLVSLLLILLVFPAFAQSLKSIELEWDAVDNAGSYEVKLLPESGGTAMQFSSVEPKLTQQVPIGNYTLQVRARSTDGTDFSPWSEPMPFAVVVKELEPLHPADKSIVDSDGIKKQTVEFRWTPVENVKLYTLIVWSEDKKDTPYVFTTKDTSKKLEVPAAQVYYWQVKFESADDVAYQQQPKTFTFTLLGKSLVKPEINHKMPTQPTALSWRAVPSAKEYTAKLYYRHLDETEWSLVSQTKLAGENWAVGKLKAGSYKIEVIAMAPRRIPSDPANYEFQVKPSLEDLGRALATARR